MGYRFHFSDLLPHTAKFLDGFAVTVQLATLALLLSFVLAVLLAFGRVFGSPFARRAISVYTEVIRNTPFLVQLFLVFFGLSSFGLRLTPFNAALSALVLNSAAYLAEILRAGITSLPKGQVEAARVLGMGRVQIIRDILFAQVVSRMFPALCAQMNVLVLNTSVGSAIALDELTGMSMIIASNTYRSFEVFAIMSAIYLALTLVVSGALHVVGRLAFPWMRG